MKKLILLPIILIGVVIGSFVTIHLLAFLGIFLAIAYPIWWIFMPKNTPCLICNSGQAGGTCMLCNKPIDKTDIHAKSLSCALKNSLIIFVLSLFSLGVVYVESKVLKYFGIPATPQTASFVLPYKGQYKLQEIFPLPIELVGLTTPINTVRVDIGYDPRKLQIVDISTQESFANIFIQKEINNDQGYARIIGGLPNPGYTNERGLFSTIYFQGKEPGVTSVTYLNSSLVLANDGRGTNVLKDPGKINLVILPDRLTQEESEKQTAIFNTQVLGASTDSSQLTFYSDHEPSVLGATSQVVEEENNWILTIFSNMINSILKFWEKILS